MWRDLIYDNFARGEKNLSNALRDPRVRIFEAGGDIITPTFSMRRSSADGVFPPALWLPAVSEFRSAFGATWRCC
jgi:UDP-glucose 4-epimerase